MNVFDILERAKRHHSMRKAVVYGSRENKDFDGVGFIDYRIFIFLL